MPQFLPYPELKPKTAAAEKLIVFLHGFGSDGNDLISLAPYFQSVFPAYHFIAPHGIEPCGMLTFGRQWFDLENRSLALLQELTGGNAPKVHELISEKQKELNLTNKDTIIIGFSQGTMIGLYLVLTQKDSYAGLIGFSGRLIPPPACLNKSTQVCLIHGIEDDVVPASEADTIEHYLLQNEVMCESHKLPNLAHSIDMRGIEIAMEFLGRV